MLRENGKTPALLLQSELGDLYCVTLTISSGTVSGVSVHYYDTVPVAISLLALGASPGGRLLVAGEGNGGVVVECEDVEQQQQQQQQ